MYFKTNQGKLLTKHKVPRFVVRKELTLAFRQLWFKIIFLSQYREQKYLVCIGP